MYKHGVNDAAKLNKLCNTQLKTSLNNQIDIKASTKVETNPHPKAYLR